MPYLQSSPSHIEVDTQYDTYDIDSYTHRNQHIGAFLYHSLMNLAKGTKRQMHWVISTNDNAIKRYKHYGYIAESLYDYVLLNKKV